MEESAKQLESQMTVRGDEWQQLKHHLEAEVSQLHADLEQTRKQKEDEAAQLQRYIPSCCNTAVTSICIYLTCLPYCACQPGQYTCGSNN